MGIFSAIFGGGTSSSSRASQDEQAAANLRAEQFIKSQTAGATADVKRIFPEAFRVGAEGIQGALDIFGQGVPAGIEAFQQGNVGAQQITADTLPQIMAALLGTGVDPSVFQPQTIDVDTSFLQGQTAPVATDVFAPPAPITPPGRRLPGTIFNAMRGITSPGGLSSRFSGGGGRRFAVNF